MRGVKRGDGVSQTLCGGVPLGLTAESGAEFQPLEGTGNLAPNSSIYLEKRLKYQ